MLLQSVMDPTDGNLPTFPTRVMRLSFVAGDTNDLSFSNRLLSLEMTATLKPKHTHTDTHKHTNKRRDTALICRADRQTKAAPFNAKTFELNPVHMKVSIITGAHRSPNMFIRVTRSIRVTAQQMVTLCSGPTKTTKTKNVTQIQSK